MLSFVLGTIIAFCICFKIESSIYQIFFIRVLLAFSYMFLFCKFSFSSQFILFIFFVFLLIYASVIDYLHMLISSSFSIFLMGVGIILSFTNMFLGETYLLRFINSSFGIFIGGGSLVIIRLLGQFIYKREVLGSGDIGFIAGIGSFIGYERVLFAIFLATFIVSLVSLVFAVIKKIKRKKYIPFGPFLSIAAFITIFLPQPSFLIESFKLPAIFNL